MTYPGGVTREVDYDVRGPVSEIRIKPPAGTPLIEKWAYAYTDVLNVATMTDAASRVTTYGYDNLDRLTSADHPTLPAPLDTLPSLETFTYDGVGNRTMSGYAHDANHRMRTKPGHTHDYDDDGNTKVRDPGPAGQATYTWDQDNRLAAYASGATSAAYKQDPFARRVKKTVGSTTTWYLWAADQLLAEYDGTGTRSARYTQLDGFAPAQMAVPNGGSELMYSLHSDRLSAPRVMTAAAGSVVWQAAYEAYGKAHLSTALSTPLNVRLPGQYLDAESDAHDNIHRVYSPRDGRYLSIDPIGHRGGSSLYSYVQSRPLNAVDRFGLYEDDVHFYRFRSIALQVGFSTADADAVASFNDSMDIAEQDQPYLNPDKHFRDRPGIEVELDRSIRDCNLRDFGRAMHAYQDSYSHAGYSAWTGGHVPMSILVWLVNVLPGVHVDDPDDFTPDTDPMDAEMDSMTIEWLNQLKAKCSCY